MARIRVEAPTNPRLGALPPWFSVTWAWAPGLLPAPLYLVPRQESSCLYLFTWKTGREGSGEKHFTCSQGTAGPKQAKPISGQHWAPRRPLLR